MLADGHGQVEMEEEKEKDHDTLPADGRGPEDLDLPPSTSPVPADGRSSESLQEEERGAGS